MTLERDRVVRSRDNNAGRGQGVVRARNYLGLTEDPLSNLGKTEPERPNHLQ